MNICDDDDPEVIMPGFWKRYLEMMENDGKEWKERLKRLDKAIAERRWDRVR